MDLKETYERFLEEEHSKARQVRRGTVLRRMKEQLGLLERFDQEITQLREQAGMSLRDLLDRCIALCEHLPSGPTAPSRLPRYAHWHQARPRIESYESALRRVQADAVASRHPLSIVSPRLTQEEDPVEVVASAIQQASERLQDLQAKLDSCGLATEEWNTLAKIVSLIQYANQIVDFTRAGQMPLLDPISDLSRRFDGQLKKLAQQRTRLAEAATKTTAWRSRLPLPEIEIALEQVKKFEANFFAWLSPQWWRLRRILNRAYDFSSHVVKPSWRQVLETLQAEYAQQGEVEATEKSIAQEFRVAGDVAQYVARVQRILRGPEATAAAAEPNPSRLAQVAQVGGDSGLSRRGLRAL